MRITLSVTGGARNGLSKSFDQAYVGLGRHPQSDLQFDPEKDLDASTRHAAVLKTGASWTIRDLGSANGTFVNGEKVTSDRRLHTGDQVRLGTKGPTLLVEVEGEAAPVTAKGATSATGAAGAAGGKHGNTAQRIKVEVEKQTKSLRQMTVALFGLLVVVAAGYFWQKASYEKKLAGMQSAMLHQLDSLQAATQDVTVRFGAMRHALDSANQVAQQLRGQIEAGGDQRAMAGLRRALDDAMRGQRGLQAAAGLDASHVDSLAGAAIALVIVKFPGNRSFSGSAWALKSDANGTYLVTNRHVVTSEQGEDPIELGVYFNHSNQFFRATLVRRHPDRDIDLALIRVQVRGGTPVVPGISTRTPVVGEPVVTIGYPQGLDLAGTDIAHSGANATLTAGTISRLSGNVVQIDGYGATGASGSPYLDARGEVVAVLNAGNRESGGRIVYAVPASRVAELLQE